MDDTKNCSQSLVTMTKVEYKTYADLSWSQSHADLLNSLSMKEIRKLTRLGKRDGKHGVVRQNDAGTYTSPWMNRVAMEYNEADTRLWNKANIQFMESFSRLRDRLKSVSEYERKLRTAAQEKATYFAENATVPIERFKGEEKLPDSIVLARRSKTILKAKAELSSACSSAKSALYSTLSEISSLHSQLYEADNTTRMISHALLFHVQQQITCYWNAVLRNHPEKEKLPVIPLIQIQPEGEKIFYEFHKILEESEQVLKRYGMTVFKKEEERGELHVCS